MFEITELNGNTQRLSDVVARYREAGARVAIDDFGAGHSQLDRVLALQPDILKLDMRLFKDAAKGGPSGDVVKALAQMAERTGCWIIAEGVETAAELEFALECGARYVQGFLFARGELEFFASDAFVQQFAQLRDQYVQHKLAERTRLMRLREKVQALLAAGVARVLCVQFNETLRSLSAEAFIDKVLLDGLAIKHLVVGDDFRFGKNRTGSFDLLALAAEQHQFGLYSTSSLLLGQQRISSTLIRQALADDKLTLAAEMLGRPFALTGRVRHGRKLGRDLGFPTANVFLYRRKLPVAGVYAITANTVFGTHYGVANIGNRPTVQGQRQQLEAHLFDFKGDLYGSQIEVTLHKKLRSEQRFDGLAALQQQIAADVAAAKAFFQHDVAEAAHVTIDKTEQNG